MSKEINMQRYCVYNDKTKQWDVSVPITWSGIKKAPVESLGSFQTELDAVVAVEEFFTMTAKPKLGGIMARSEADEQTIKALRIRVASLEASLARLKKYVPVGTPPPTEKSVYDDYDDDDWDDFEDDEWYGFNQRSMNGNRSSSTGYMNAVNGFDT